VARTQGLKYIKRVGGGDKWSHASPLAASTLYIKARPSHNLARNPLKFPKNALCSRERKFPRVPRKNPLGAKYPKKLTLGLFWRLIDPPTVSRVAAANWEMAHARNDG